MIDNTRTTALEQQTSPHQQPTSPPLCSPAAVAERTLVHALLALSSLILVVAQALANGVTSPADTGSAETRTEESPPVTIEAAPTPAPPGCRAPLVTREAFAAWADGLIARRIGIGR